MPEAHKSTWSLLWYAVSGGLFLFGLAGGVIIGYMLWGERQMPLRDNTTAPIEVAATEPAAPAPETPPTPTTPDLAAPPSVPAPETPAAAPSETSASQPAPVVEPLEEEADVWPGRHLFLSIDGVALDSATRALLGEIKPGGVVLLAENFQSEKQAGALIKDIKAAVGLGEGIGDLPLIAIDQEGGPVNRLNIKDAPGAWQLGALADIEKARAVARIYADACHAIGIGVVFAPVLDVYDEGGNERIKERCFSSDSRIVSAMGLAFSSGLMDGGVLSVVKHFPGHGSTLEDSHETIAVLARNKSGMADIMLPFSDAVAAGIPGVMVGHIAVPSLNPDNPKEPASLSRPILDGFLRARWDYQGVILSDDISMKAVTNERPVEEAAVEALEAGNDAFILVERNPDRVRGLCQAIEKAVNEGGIPRAQLQESMKRLDAWQAWLRNPKPLPGPLPAMPQVAIAPAHALPAVEAAPPPAPTPAPASAPPANATSHTVQAGEHLGGIAARYKVKVQNLLDWNQLKDTNVRIGQVLRVAAPESAPAEPPHVETPPAPAPAPAPAPTPTPEPGPAPPPPPSVSAQDTDIHIVASGETLFSLARQYGISVRELTTLNGMNEDSILRTGSKLKVPKRTPGNPPGT